MRKLLQRDSTTNKIIIPAQLTIVFIFLVIFTLSSVFVGGFLTYNNIFNLVRQTSINGVVAIGMTFVIITAGIDLSVGAVVGLSSVITSLMLVRTDNIPLSIATGILAGTVVGLINALAIFEGNVPAFIATLGTQISTRGLVMLITKARLIAGLPERFTLFAQKTIIGIPSLAIVWFIVAAIGGFITRYTLFGRNIYAIGSNREASRLSGVNLRKNIYGVYVFASLLSAIAGILLTSRMANGIPTAGTGFEQDAITAAVIGGASFYGGEGTIWGTMLGAMIMQTLRNSGTLLGIESFVLDILVGALLIIAVMLDQLKKKQE
jgi:ribose transport system permease protein